MTRSLRGLASALLAAGLASAAADGDELVQAPDVALSLPALATPVLDRQAVRERSGAPPQRRLFDVPDLPDGIGVAALDYDHEGRLLLAIDGWVELPGAGLVGPRHVVRSDGSGAWEVIYAGLDDGIPDGVGVDALAWIDPPENLLFVSFDVAIRLGSTSTVQDEDFVAIENGSIFAWFDRTTGLDDGLDLDGLSRGPYASSITVSFDGSGEVGGLAFDDEDILVLSLADDSLTMAYDASASAPGWAAANLAAFAVLAPGIFADGVESGGTDAWSDTTP